MGGLSDCPGGLSGCPWVELDLGLGRLSDCPGDLSDPWVELDLELGCWLVPDPLAEFLEAVEPAFLALALVFVIFYQAFSW